jgi:putative DNA primase/helicase
MKFTLYASNCIGIAKNCYYQKKIEVVDEASLVRAVSYDHVTALYKDGYRAKSNFVKADNIPMDCDNDHSEKTG